MAKISGLFSVVAFLMIFALATKQSSASIVVVGTNEATPRKLGARQLEITSLPNTNEATFGGSGHQYSSISSLSAHANAIITPQDGIIIANKATPLKIGMRQGVITNEATPRKLGARQKIIAKEATARKLGARHNAVTSSLAQTSVIFPKGPIIITNEATARKLRKRQNPIIITSSSDTNEAADSRESELHSFPISSSPTQTNRVFPRDPDETGHVSSSPTRANRIFPRDPDETGHVSSSPTQANVVLPRNPGRGHGD